MRHILERLTPIDEVVEREYRGRPGEPAVILAADDPLGKGDEDVRAQERDREHTASASKSTARSATARSGSTDAMASAAMRSAIAYPLRSSNIIGTVISSRI
jgi:hypothetical protein